MYIYIKEFTYFKTAHLHAAINCNISLYVPMYKLSTLAESYTNFCEFYSEFRWNFGQFSRINFLNKFWRFADRASQYIYLSN